jgi:predicted CopG family antitoxin
MSTKTIAVNSQVYRRLASAKREGESFSRAIDRLLREVGTAHSGSRILAGLETLTPLSEADAQVFLNVVDENRSDEAWEAHDLR